MTSASGLEVRDEAAESFGSRRKARVGVDPGIELIGPPVAIRDGPGSEEPALRKL